MGRERHRLFRPLSWVMARAPLLPVEAFLALSGEHPQSDLFWPGKGAPATAVSHAATMALKVASGDLSEAMQAQDGAGPDGATDKDLRQKLLRYRIRMSTRPTPYGAFAGVALCDTGAITALALDGSYQCSARPDMEWLLTFIESLERSDDVLGQLELVAHPCLRRHGDRVVLDDPTLLHEGAGAVSISASEFVVAAIDAARTPLRHDELLGALMRCQGADYGRLVALIRKLVEQGFLLTELRPPLTGTAPAHHLLDKLRALPSPPPQAEALAKALDAVAHWSRLDTQAASEQFPELEQSLVVLHEGPKSRLQVDLAIGFSQARIGKPLLDIAGDIAELLLRLTPIPHGSPALQAYRSAFLAKYGAHRHVPLLEVLDGPTGLGALSMQGNPSVDGTRLARRQATLQAMAQTAMADHQHEIELSDALIARLALWDPVPEQLPLSVDLCLMVLADSLESINNHNWQVVVGPNLGSRQAGRYLGRFADMLGPWGRNALLEAAQAEQRHLGDAIWAESVYLPKRLRSANVAIRPAVRSHEIAIGVTAGVGSDHSIPLADLTVGLSGERLGLFWGHQEVRVCAGHMLTSFQAPQVSRFIEELAQDGIAQYIGFDWGPASAYAYLPRIVWGRAILSPAQWCLSREILGGGKDCLMGSRFPEVLRAFAKRWHLPRYIYMVEGDNRLLLDLEEPEHFDQLRIDLVRKSEFGVIFLQEALPGPEHAWLHGPYGHSLVELVVPLVRRPAPGDGPRPTTATAQAETPPPVAPGPAASGEPVLIRKRPPGSDWLFVKLYGDALREDALLAGAVREFCAKQVASARCASWFFIRYSDPESHLRLRLRGDPNRILAELVPQVCSWAAELMVADQIKHFAFDTYEREMERYGGPAGMAWAESVFAVDSASVVDMLQRLTSDIQGPGNVDRLSLLTISLDCFLSDLGIDQTQRLVWCKSHVFSRHPGGPEYRERKQALRAWFALQHREKHWPSWVGDLLGERGRSLRALGNRWSELQQRGLIIRDHDFMLSSLVHMHCNRFGSIDRTAEQKALGMLLRLREGLVKAPVA